MWIPPLLVIPLLVYNAVSFGIITSHALGWVSPVASISMPSGGVWSINAGDLLIFLALGLLLIEMFRARRGPGAHPLGVLSSGLLLGAYLGEFLLVPAASTSLFFICVCISAMDFSTRATFFVGRGRKRFH